MLSTFFNRGGADWKKYKGPYKFWIEDAETGETVVEKQVDLFKGEFEFINVLDIVNLGYTPYTPAWKTENYLKEFPNEEWHISLPINHTYNIKYSYQSNDLISFCKTFPILDDEGNTLITSFYGREGYLNAWMLDYTLRKTMMYSTHTHGNGLEYILPIDQWLVDQGEQYEGFPVLKPNTEYVYEAASQIEFTQSALNDLYIRVFPIPFVATAFGEAEQFQSSIIQVVLSPS